jgi:hypothetical protein
MRHRTTNRPVSRWSSTLKPSPADSPTYIESGDNRIRRSMQPASDQQLDPPPTVQPPPPPLNHAPSTPSLSLSPDDVKAINQQFPALTKACVHLAQHDLKNLTPDEIAIAEGAAPRQTKGSIMSSAMAPPPVRSKKPSKPRRRVRGARLKNSESISLAQHERCCSICNHPERDTIEEAFLQWRSPQHLWCEFKLPSRTSIYRHAHAVGLFDKRSRNLRSALEHIIEDAERVKPTAEGVIQAIRAYTRVNRAGEWIDPPTHVVVSSGSSLASNSLNTAASPSTVTEIQRDLPTSQLVAPVVQNLLDTRTQAENGATR